MPSVYLYGTLVFIRKILQVSFTSPANFYICILTMSNKLPHQVIQSLKRGDHRAFEKVFVAYFNKVRYFIFRLVRSDHEAEELAQDVFVRLWTNRASIDLSKSFDAYLFSIAYNATCNYLKRKTVRNDYQNSVVLPELDFTPEELLYAREIELLVEMTVNEMPEQRKRIFHMSRKNGFSNEEIANKLQITKKTVENQLSLALKELRKVIGLFLLFHL